MWYWRQGRSAFGRFEKDDDGLFFMRGIQLLSSASAHPTARKRARAIAEASTEVLKSSE
jgi:hypothetical protein